MTTAHEKRVMGATLALCATLACGGENGPPAGSGLALAKASASGDAQVGAVASTLPTPLAVVVTRDGQPDDGVTVTWSVLTGGGTPGSASSATDAQGIATTTWNLGTTAGAQTMRASVSGATGSPVTFAATATAAAAAQMALADGSGQSAAINSALADPLQVRVTDMFGNPVPGVTVDWAVTGGGGSVAPPSSQSSATGLAATSWTLGPTLGAQSAEATAGLAGSPVLFAATGTQAPNPGTGVTVANNSFTPAIRTVPSGTTVTWTWVNTGIISHNVESTGTPSFTSSPILMGAGQTYSVQFDTPGTYTYECVVHGSVMSGSIVVQ